MEFSEQLEDEMLQDSVEDSSIEQTESQREPQEIDLDKLERFKWQGKEYSRDDLRNMTMMRSDYTKKTQELAEARKYAENLPFDLEKVWANPQIADKFKEIYPKEYHHLVDKILAKVSSDPRQSNQGRSTTQDDPRLSRLEQEMNQWKQEKYEQQVKAIDREIDAELTKGMEQYKDVLRTDTLKNRFEIDCLHLAQQLHNSGTQLTPELWAKITKEVANDLRSLTGVARRDVVSKQRQANQVARDVPPGGGIPGQAPKKFKNIREAMHAIMSDEDL